MAGSFGEEFVFPELGGAEAAEAMHPEVTGTPIKVAHVHVRNLQFPHHGRAGPAVFFTMP